MNSITKLVSKISSIFDFNKATLSGALDVIVIEHEDGTMVCNPFRVRFGMLKIIKSRAQMISLTINGQHTEITMKLNPEGEGIFCQVNDSSPFREERKVFSEESSPVRDKEINLGFGGDIRNKPLPIPPKLGDYCDDLIAGDEEGEEDQEIDVEMSICADKWEEEEDKEALFAKYVVGFEEFSRAPWEIINNPALLIKLGTKVYNKEVAVPIILSLIVYKKSLEIPAARSERVSEERGKQSNMTLTSDQLKSLGLNYGRNDVVYTANTQLQGVQEIKGRIYLWKSDSKIVISDIDGTITKSDVLGHLFSFVGKDWSHPGVAKFYNMISENGYKFIYLSSRAIGQANTTRNYLHSLKQDDFLLPDGPLIISPDRLLKSLLREMVERTPQKFKSSALIEIQNLFPPSHLPFFAGFGNRDTDAIAYRSVGIPLDKIFIIDPTGHIFAFNENTYTDSYPQLSSLLPDIFPPLA